MGELLCSAHAKRLVNQHQVVFRSKALRMHQWRISLLGACWCHWRGTIEPMVPNGSLEPLVAADLDLVNMFGNTEWPRCARISWRSRPGPNGSTRMTLSPLFPRGATSG